MDSKRKKILIHITGCILFLTLPLFFAPGVEFSVRGLTSPFMLRELTSYLIMIGFFYLNSYLLIPRLYFKRKYIFFYLTAFLCYVFVTLIPYLLIHIPLHSPPP